ncbi:hypothetical protein KM043_018581 [Ampulex compressa]|nr:hypothetical protein KM043_018581 [Ampulex compressa]
MGFCELAVAGFARKKEKNKRLDELRVAITDVLFNVEQHTTTNTDQLINMQLFLRFTRHNFTKTFHTELSAEMNNIRAGVDAALAEGRHAAYCFEDAENARKKIQRVIEDGAYSCTNTSLYDFLHRLSIFVKIAEKGKKMVRQIRNQSCVDGAE